MKQNYYESYLHGTIGRTSETGIRYIHVVSGFNEAILMCLLQGGVLNAGLNDKPLRKHAYSNI